MRTADASGRAVVTTHVRSSYRGKLNNDGERKDAGYSYNYDVDIHNTGDVPVQLMTRHWVFTGADGRYEAHDRRRRAGQRRGRHRERATTRRRRDPAATPTRRGGGARGAPGGSPSRGSGVQLWAGDAGWPFPTGGDGRGCLPR